MEEFCIRLEQKGAVDRLRQKYGHSASSHAFQSLYIWQKEMKLTLFLKEELFAVKAGLWGPNTWFSPCGGEAERRAFVEEHLEEEDFALCYVRREEIEEIESWFPGKFAFSPEPAANEYLYSRMEQAFMPGRKFSKLRNHWNRAVREHHLEVVPLNEQTISSAVEITKEWERSHSQAGMLGLQDDGASGCLLAHWKELKLQGILLFVDGEPYAMTAGFSLSENTFDLCLAKQRGMLPGISVYAKWALYQQLPPEIAVINAEEDMGIEGLRMMKQQMKPTGMIEMYNGKVRRG